MEVHLRRLIDGLRAAGDDVELFTAAGERQGMAKLLDIWDPVARRRLAETARRPTPDVVHFHNIARELSASVLGAVRGAPKVMTFHDHRLLGAPDVSHQPRLRASLISATCVLDRRVARRHLDAAIALSRDTALLLARYGFRDVCELGLFAPVPPEPTTEPGQCHTIVFAGRLAPDKGAALLGKAFEKIAEQHPELRLVFAGEGPERPELERLAGRWPDRIELTGRVEEDRVHELMATARLVVAPSSQRLRPETGPQTVMEAALLGRPVITAEGVPMAALVRASGGGLVVRPDDVDDLARGLEAFARDPAAASAAGRAARIHAVARHATEVAIPQLRAVYRRLAGHGAGVS
ncbi:MAG: hypothetical protein QOJ67_2231 [Acidimicrobiaceae bacterium]